MKHERRRPTPAEWEAITSRRPAPRRDDTVELGHYAEENAGGQWELVQPWRGRLADFVLFFAMALSLLGEVASVLADQLVPAALFLLTTLLLCGVAWRRGGV